MRITSYKLQVKSLRRSIKHFRKSSGFTLVETLIYIAILGGLMAYFISFTLSISNSRSKSYVIEEVNANARIALETISEKIRAADSILKPTPGIPLNSLTLDMPAPDDDIIFDVQSGVLVATINSIFYPITSNEVLISNPVFINLNPEGEIGNVRISFTIEYRDPESKEYEYSRGFQTAVSLRH